jgi:hypothetical protein
MLIYDADVNVVLIVAGSFALLGAAIHGIAGDLLVVRKLSPETLPASRLGSPRMTKAMIHVTWHITTIAFLTVGALLVLSGAGIDDDAARWMSLVGACAATGFAAVAVVLGGSAASPSAAYRHPGPAVLTITAALAWWGALSL